MNTLKLCLHKGGKEASIIDVEAVVTPEPTESWTPIPHHSMIEQVRSSVTANGLRIGGEVHALAHEGDRYFGMMEVMRGSNDGGDYRWVLGIRNSHDQRFSAGMVAGMGVFVCDNLSFSGEVKMNRKHTVHAVRDLPNLIQGMVGQLAEKWTSQDKRVLAYKERQLSDIEVHDLLVRSVDQGVMANSHLPKVLKEWRNPRHEAFADRNAWSLFNDFTEVLKDSSVFELPKRTIALHDLLDNHIGLSIN